MRVSKRNKIQWVKNIRMNILGILDGHFHCSVRSYTPVKLIGTFCWTMIKSSMLYRNTKYSNDGLGKEQVKVELINEKWRKKACDNSLDCIMDIWTCSGVYGP